MGRPLFNLEASFFYLYSISRRSAVRPSPCARAPSSIVKKEKAIRESVVPGSCLSDQLDQYTPLPSRDASEEPEADMDGELDHSAKRYALLMDTGIFTTRVSDPNWTVT